MRLFGLFEIDRQDLIHHRRGLTQNLMGDDLVILTDFGNLRAQDEPVDYPERMVGNHQQSSGFRNIGPAVKIDVDAQRKTFDRILPEKVIRPVIIDIIDVEFLMWAVVTFSMPRINALNRPHFTIGERKMGIWPFFCKVPCCVMAL